MKRLLSLVAAMGLSVGLMSNALAAYPDKPVTIVVPFAAGGPTDKVARDLAEVLRKGLNNQSVIIENVVAFTVAQALVDKFGGDSIAEMQARWSQYHDLARRR